MPYSGEVARVSVVIVCLWGVAALPSDPAVGLRNIGVVPEKIPFFRSSAPHRGLQDLSQQQHRELLLGGSIWNFSLSILNAILRFWGFPGFNNDDDDGVGEDDILVQYTPDPVDWSRSYSLVDDSSLVLDHSPDGITWLPNTAWVPWDGTVYDPRTMTDAEFASAVCPTGDTIRGLREVFYEHNPFANLQRPTKAEVDHWHSIALTHLRRLVGIDHPAVPDHCLFARALWSQERKLSTQWDDAYPDNTCVGSNNFHCGATFVPGPEDQVPYLPSEDFPPCAFTSGGSEAISTAPKMDIPWSIKWVRAFCGFLNSEGPNGGHVGPFLRRETFGFSFWDVNPDSSNSNAVLRAKWGGELVSLPWAE